MLDIQTGATAPPIPTPPIEFFTIQLSRSRGGISASVRSTSFDEADFDLIDQDIATCGSPRSTSLWCSSARTFASRSPALTESVDGYRSPIEV